jgi:hypothetical protein
MADASKSYMGMVEHIFLTCFNFSAPPAIIRRLPLSKLGLGSSQEITGLCREEIWYVTTTCSGYMVVVYSLLSRL